MGKMTLHKRIRTSPDIGIWNQARRPSSFSSQRRAGTQDDFTLSNISTTRRALVDMEAERRGTEEERRVNSMVLAGGSEEEESEERKREVEAMKRVRGEVKPLPFWLGGWMGGS